MGGRLFSGIVFCVFFYVVFVTFRKVYFKRCVKSRRSESGTTVVLIDSVRKYNYKLLVLKIYIDDCLVTVTMPEISKWEVGSINKKSGTVFKSYKSIQFGFKYM